MNEMLKPEMLRDMNPRETPKSGSEESAPESGVRRSAEPRKVMDTQGENAAKAEAQRKMEDAFFARGDAMNAAHMAGETLAPNAAELQAQENEAMRAARQERMDLNEEIARAGNGVKQAAEYLRSTHQIDDPEAALAQRAMGGTWGKVKSFFGRFSNGEQRAKDQALDTYDKMGKKLADLQAKANEMDMRLNKPMMVQQSRRITAERNQPGQR